MSFYHKCCNSVHPRLGQSLLATSREFILENSSVSYMYIRIYLVGKKTRQNDCEYSFCDNFI